MYWIYRIISTGQDGEPLTDEDDNTSNSSYEEDGKDDESEDEVTRNSDLQVRFTCGDFTHINNFLLFWPLLGDNERLLSHKVMHIISWL